MEKQPMSDFSSRPAPRRWLTYAVVAAMALAAAGIALRLHARAELRKLADDSAIPVVLVTQVKRAPARQELVLPGSVEAWVDAPIYARANGYLKRWLVDIGAHVKAGDLLAEIDTPEIDQQAVQAQAELAQAQANEQLARSTTQRYQKLLVTNAVSRQDAEDRAGDYKAKKALRDSAQANLQRLRDTRGFQQIVAPFDGTVTARHTDIGQLVSNGSGTELFHIADLRKLRIYAQVPQPYASATQPGLTAELRFAERPNQSYPATIVSTADALDAASRTLLVQLEVDNQKGELFPGAYGELHFKLPGPADTVRVPANALIFRGDGMQVAVVGADNHVALKPITVGRDFGTDIEVLTGVTTEDRIIVNPSDSIGQGAEVRIAENKSAPKPDEH